MSKITLGRNCPFCNAKPVTYTRDPASKREIFECYTTIDNAESLDPELNVVNRGKTCLRRQQEKRNEQIAVLLGLSGKRPSANWMHPSRDELCEEIHLLKGENCKLVDEVDNLQNRLGEVRIKLAQTECALQSSRKTRDASANEYKELREKFDFNRALVDLKDKTIIKLQNQINELDMCLTTRTKQRDKLLESVSELQVKLNGAGNGGIIAIKNAEIVHCNEIIKNLRANYSIAIAKCKANDDAIESLKAQLETTLTESDVVSILKQNLKTARAQLAVEQTANDRRAEIIVRLQTQHNTLLDENRWLRSKVDN